jgi:DNA-binding transcriptional regulator YdaS (Cro superfamily)
MDKRDPSVVDAWTAAGGAQVLAASLGIRVSAIYQWRRVPAERVREVALVTGLLPHQLRPDLYDAPKGALHHDTARNDHDVRAVTPDPAVGASAQPGEAA